VTQTDPTQTDPTQTDPTRTDSTRTPEQAGQRRRIPDRVIWLSLALGVAILIAACVVAVLSYRNPSVPPLTLPTASIR
jgi:hypothetical protein